MANKSLEWKIDFAVNIKVLCIFTVLGTVIYRIYLICELLAQQICGSHCHGML